MSKRRRKGVGQSHTAKPDLQDYVVPPASEVVVRSLDGSVIRTEPAAPAKTPQRRKRRKRSA